MQSKRPLQFFSKRAVRRTFIALAAVILLYTLLGFLAVPALLKYQIEKGFADKLQRQASIDEIRFNPYTLILSAHGFKLTERQDSAVFAAFDTLTLDIAGQSILKRAPIVQSMRLTKPEVHLARLDAHRYNIDDIVELIASQPPSEEPARFSLNNIELADGAIRFDDRPARTVHRIDGIGLGIPFISSLPADVALYVEPALSANINGTPLSVKGKARPFADPKDALVQLDLDELDVAGYLKYLPFQPAFKVPSGKLKTALTVSFRQPKDQPPAVLVSGTAQLLSLQIQEANGKPVLRLPELKVDLRDLDLLSGRLHIARIAANGLDANISRDADGMLNLQRLIPPSKPEPSKPAPAKAAPAKDGGLKLQLDELDIRRASLRYQDGAPAQPLTGTVDGLNLSLRKLMLDTGGKSVSVAEVASDGANLIARKNKGNGASAEKQALPAAAARPAEGNAASYKFTVDKLAITDWSARIEDNSQATPVTFDLGAFSLASGGLSSTPSAPMPLELKTTLNKAGQLALRGDVNFAPLQADLAVDLKNFDILPLQPYISDYVNLRLTRADLSSSGKLQLARADTGAWKGGFKGDMKLANLATVDRQSASEFLRWKSLSLSGMDIGLAPFAVTVDQVALADFFARVIIDPNGRINLQDVMRDKTNTQQSLTERTAQDGGARTAQASGDARPAPAPSAIAAAPAADTNVKTPVTIRKLTLQNGRVRFTDNFIRPNYSANLMNFGGTVTGLSSDQASSANVELKGEVNSAPLAIAGRVNPLRRDLFLDIKANVRGMDLASLSPYSNRYIGYGIEKGKLSFEVSYQVEDRKLTAQNRLILDQLTLGARSDSPLAVKLPVQLAIALLRDNNGVIDLEVPVGGSLDDPQFSIGGIVFKVIFNAIAKAVTQPFAFLGSVFGGGGGGELSTLAFAPGSFAIPEDGETKLKALAKAMADRPALKLEIEGRADPAADIAGLRRYAVERKVRSLKIRELRARGEPAERGNVTVSPQEYPALLARAYKEEKFDKPRNLIGLPKDLPVPEMEKLMAEHAVIEEEDLLALGNRRAQATRDWLLQQGQIPAERVFLLAAKTGGGEGKEAGARVDFSLR